MKNLAVPQLVFALVLHIFGYYTLLRRIEPYMYQFYMMAWWSYIIFLDGVLALRTGRHLVLNRRLPSLISVSAAFWCVFELINLRMENWFYINVPYGSAVRFCGYLLAYGTVIPAIYLTKEALSRLLPELRITPVSPGGYGTYAIPLGLLCLALCLAFPLYLFGLSWVFLVFVADGYNYRKGYSSFMADIEHGSAGEVVAAALAGMICGFLWEFWNYWSITKWVYTVPFLEDVKLFEMPAPGYLGFALFGLETIAFVNLLGGSPCRRRLRWAVPVLALVFSFLSFLLIDRYTVFSYTSPVAGLSFLTEGTRDALEKGGVETSHAIDPRMLTSREGRGLALMHLDGLGAANLDRLKGHGIDTIGGLAGLDERQLSSMIEEKNMRRVRIYLRAAQKYQRAHCRSRPLSG
ncbi:MAG: hypothetical protein ABSC19_09435 [Syntrophorhabdales bacterium]